LGDSSYSLTANPGHLRLYTPDGGHDLYPSANLDAPRMLQEIDGDFVATAKVTIHPVYSFQGAGLLIWQDQDNYIRLEKAPGPGINKAYRIGGQYFDINPDYPTAQTTVFLGFQRVGNTFHGLFSEDGTSWVEILTVEFSAANTLLVGLDLINQWQDHPIYADFDYFRLDSCTQDSSADSLPAR